MLERNRVKCPRGSFIENAMCNVNELGRGHTFFHIEPVQKRIRNTRRKDLQGPTDVWHSVILGFCHPCKDGQKASTQVALCAATRLCEQLGLEEMTNFLGATRDCFSNTDPHSARY